MNSGAWDYFLHFKKKVVKKHRMLLTSTHLKRSMQRVLWRKKNTMKRKINAGYIAMQDCESVTAETECFAKTFTTSHVSLHEPIPFKIKESHNVHYSSGPIISVFT